MIPILNKLDDLLLAQKAISMDQYNELQKYKKKHKVSSMTAITELRLLDYNGVYRAIAQAMNVEFIAIKDSFKELDDKVISLLSEDIARTFNVLPWKLDGNTLELLIENPQDSAAIKEAEAWTGKKVRPVMTIGKQLTEIIDYYFKEKNVKAEIEKLAKLGSDDIAGMVSASEFASPDASTPIVQLLNRLFEQSAVYKASDIHIKANEKNVRIRMRVDGELREITQLPIKSLGAIISRIKVLANLNIAEKRIPQDGAFTYKGRNCLLEMRVSILPSLFGESCVLRVIDKRGGDYDFKKLGMSQEDEEAFRKMIGRPDGLVLVTGPTGSGKSTTLYTALKHLNKATTNIITVEDPVESPIENINQVQVNSAVGLDFSAALRSILRHDPDIIFIGEIRDTETAQIAVRSAITGHLVLSTLHTNDAISAIMRLGDMGVEKYLVTSALAGVVAQRLLKRVCPSCCQDYVLNDEEASLVGLPAKTVTKIGTGCVSCGNTGYSGRIAIYEFVRMTRELRMAVLQNKLTDEMLDIAGKQGMITLKESCKELLLSGITSYREAVKIIFSKD